MVAATWCDSIGETSDPTDDLAMVCPTCDGEGREAYDVGDKAGWGYEADLLLNPC